MAATAVIAIGRGAEVGRGYGYEEWWFGTGWEDRRVRCNDKAFEEVCFGVHFSLKESKGLKFLGKGREMMYLGVIIVPDKGCRFILSIQSNAHIRPFCFRRGHEILIP
jgi:hypothetical protein